RARTDTALELACARASRREQRAAAGAERTAIGRRFATGKRLQRAAVHESVRAHRGVDAEEVSARAAAREGAAPACKQPEHARRSRGGARLFRSGAFLPRFSQSHRCCAVAVQANGAESAAYGVVDTVLVVKRFVGQVEGCMVFHT